VSAAAEPTRLRDSAPFAKMAGALVLHFSSAISPSGVDLSLVVVVESRQVSFALIRLVAACPHQSSTSVSMLDLSS